MIMTVGESIITIMVVVLGTILTRFLPFMIFPFNKKPPAYIQYLGEVLPYAVIGMLVIYCLKDIPTADLKYGVSEIIGVLSVAVIHIWKKNSLLSMASGTIIYMLVIQIFIG